MIIILLFVVFLLLCTAPFGYPEYFGTDDFGSGKSLDRIMVNETRMSYTKWIAVNYKLFRKY